MELWHLLWNGEGTALNLARAIVVMGLIVAGLSTYACGATLTYKLLQISARRFGEWVLSNEHPLAFICVMLWPAAAPVVVAVAATLAATDAVDRAWERFNTKGKP